MQKPIIGVTSAFNWRERNYTLAETYVESIKQAGGIPVILAHTPLDAATLAQALDALLVTGGPDVNPVYYNEDPHPKLGGIDPERDESELALLEAFIATGKPILGICRGMQALNVALGGSLFQDIYTHYTEAPLLKHGQEAPRWSTSHTVDLLPDSQLQRIFGSEEVLVNSFHHQAVKDIAPVLIVSAKAPDGIIEAIEKPGHPFCIGTQWHPECMFDRPQSPMHKLFAAFVEACCDQKKS